MNNTEIVTKKCKLFSWIIVASTVVSVIGMIFGIVGAFKFGEVYTDSDKNIIFCIAIPAGIISLIVNIITFFSMRKGQVKNALVSVSRNSWVQGIGPLVAFILGLIGIYVAAEQDGTTPFQDGTGAFVVITYVIVVFIIGMEFKTFRGFRKDKENYSFASITSFIAVVALILLMIACLSAWSKVSSEYVDYEAFTFLMVFSVLFIASDILAFITLALTSIVASKYVPKVTMADADAAKLDKISESLKEIKEKHSSSDSDNIAILRGYKKLLDEGAITQEEFDKKMKELI